MLQLNIQMERMCRAGTWGHPCPFGALHSPSPLMRSGTRSSRNAILLGFYGGFVVEARWIINSIYTPSLFQGEWGARLKVPSF